MSKYSRNFFTLTIKFIFINYKYLIFIKNRTKKNLCFFKIKSNDFSSLFSNGDSFFSFLKCNSNLVFFNDFLDFLNFSLNECELFAFSFCGYLINNNYLNNLNNYYLFYLNNLKVFINII